MRRALRAAGGSEIKSPKDISNVTAIESEVDLSEVMESLIADHSEIAYLVKQIERLQNRVSELEKIHGNGEIGEDVEVIELREISRVQAKEEITKYFKDGNYHDIGEIADKLRLDIQLVFEISNELIEEGVIGA